MNKTIGDLWCKFAHAEPMWPIHGEYECRVCGRHHPVEWTAHNVIHATGHVRLIS